MGSAMTHGDWIWKAGEDFARQVDTSLKTKGKKRKASTPRSHPPSWLAPACPAQLLPRLWGCPRSGGVTQHRAWLSLGTQGLQPSGAGRSGVHTGTCEHRAL